MGIAQPHLAALDHGIGVAELRLALPQRLDLGAQQLDPTLEPVEQLELVPGPAVGGDVAGRGLAPTPLARLSHPAPLSRHEVHASARSVDRIHTHGDRVTESQRAAAPLPHQGGLRLVQVEPLPSQHLTGSSPS